MKYFFYFFLIIILITCKNIQTDNNNFNINNIQFENSKFIFDQSKLESIVNFESDIRSTNFKCSIDNNNVSIVYKVDNDYYTLSNNEKSINFDLSKIKTIELFFTLKNKFLKYNFYFEKEALGIAKLDNISTVPVIFIPEFSKDVNEYNLKVQYKTKKIFLKATGENVSISYKINNNDYIDLKNNEFSKPIYFPTGNSTLLVKSSKDQFKDNVYKINITRYENANIKNILFSNSTLLNIIDGEDYNIYGFLDSANLSDIVEIIPEDPDSIPYLYKTGTEHLAISRQSNQFELPLNDDLNEFIVGIISVDGFIKNYKLSIAKSERSKQLFNIPESKLLNNIQNQQRLSGKNNDIVKVIPPDEKNNGKKNTLKDDIVITQKNKEEVKKIITESNVFLENLKINAIFKYNYELQLYPDFSKVNTNYETYINSSVESIEVVPILLDQELNLKVRLNDGRFRTAVSGVRITYDIKDTTITNKVEIVVSDNSGNSLLYTVLLKPFQ